MKIVQARNIEGTKKWRIYYDNGTDRVVAKPTEAVKRFILGKKPRRISCNVNYPHYVLIYK